MTVPYSLARCEPDDEALAEFDDHTIFQTRAWLAFVAQSQGGEPVVAEVRDRTEVVGRFTGVIIRRAGLRLLGSPLPGWTTSYMGFNMVAGASRAAAMVGLKRFAFGDLGCHHLEVGDRHATPADLVAGGLRVGAAGMSGYEIDLAGGQDAVFAAMKPGCRQNIRKAERVGVTIEEASDVSFAEEYYFQLQDVFAKQRLVPTYGIDRVRALIQHLAPSGRLLLLRARNASGDCIATGIYPASNDTMYFWGGASLREHQHLRPNEALHWHAMRHWMKRGMTRYDMVGKGKYKQRYGAYPIHVPSGRASRFRALEGLREFRRQAHLLRQSLLGRLLGNRSDLGSVGDTRTAGAVSPAAIVTELTMRQLADPG